MIFAKVIFILFVLHLIFSHYFKLLYDILILRNDIFKDINNFY